MQPIQTRKPHGWKWAVAGGVFALLVLAAAAFLLWPRGTTPQAPKMQEEAVTILSREAASLARMDVVASDGSAFTLVREGDGFAVEGDPDFPLEDREIALMAKDLTLLTAHDVAGEAHAGEDLSPLGFTASSPQVTATYADGQALTVRFGNDAQTEIPADYLMIAGDPKVYLVSQETRDHFDRRLETLHPVPAVDFTPSLLDTLQSEGEDPFTLSQREGLWEVTSPLRYPADEAEVRGLLQRIGKMRLAVYAGEATEANLARFGLLPARRTVTFFLSESRIEGFDRSGNAAGEERIPAQVISFSVGADIPPVGFYLLYDGEVYQASDASMGFLRDTSMKSLLASAPVTVPLGRLSSVSVIENGKTREYAVELVESILPNNDIETDGDGNILYQTVVTRDGTDVSAAFLPEYLELMRLSAAGDLPKGYAPEKTPNREITLSGDGIQMSIALAEYGPLHYAMGVNGHYLIYVDRQAADEISL